MTTIRTRKLSPTRDPSTAGARWIFAEREFLRRVGGSAKSRVRFAKVRRQLESSSDSDLRQRLAEVQVARIKGAHGTEGEFLAAEQLTIEAELGWRKRNGATRSHEEMVCKRAIMHLVREGEPERARQLLRSAAEEIGPHILPPGLDHEALIDGIINFALLK